MADQYFALKNVSCRLRDDGTNAQIEMKMVGAPDARFFVNPEGMGSLIASLRTAAGEMAKRLTASGAADRYKSGDYENAPMRALSVQVGTETSRQELSLAIQTEDGSFVVVQFPTDVALVLRDAIAQVASNLNPSSSSPKRH